MGQMPFTEACYWRKKCRVFNFSSTGTYYSFWILGIPMVMWGKRHWTIYRWPGYLVVVWFGSSPTPSPSLLSRQNRSTGDTQKDWEREKKTCWRGGGGGSQILRLKDSMVLYNSFNTLCCLPKADLQILLSGHSIFSGLADPQYVLKHQIQKIHLQVSDRNRPWERNIKSLYRTPELNPFQGDIFNVARSVKEGVWGMKGFNTYINYKVSLRISKNSIRWL